MTSNNTLTAERKREIQALISKTNQDREAEMITAIAEINKGVCPSTHLSRESHNLRKLFEMLNQVTYTCEENLLSTLETVFASYIERNPGTRTEVFRAYSTITKVLLAIYKHEDLINEKEIHYESLCHDLEKLPQL